MNAPANDLTVLDETEILKSLAGFSASLVDSFATILSAIDDMPRAKIDPAVRKLITDARPLCEIGVETWGLRKAQAEFLLSKQSRAQA